MPYISQNTADYENRFATVREYVLFNLGYPVVRVELTEKHLTIAIIDAITKYYDRAAHDFASEKISVNDDGTVDIPADVKSSMIQDVVFPMSTIDSYSKNIFALEDVVGYEVIPMQDWSSILSDFDMAGYYMYLKHLEDFKKIAGIDRHWDITNGKIYLYPADAAYTEVGIIYKAVKDDSSYETSTWIKEWALARSKYMLGTIRRKMSGFQTAGGNIAADGEALVSEAQERMRELSEQLNQLQKPLPFLQTGGI